MLSVYTSSARRSTPCSRIRSSVAVTSGSFASGLALSRFGVMTVAVATVAVRAISSRRVSDWALGVIIPLGVHHSSAVRSRGHNYPSVGKSERKTRNSPQLLRCNHEVDGTWYANPLARSEEHTSELQSLRHL